MHNYSVMATRIKLARICGVTKKKNGFVLLFILSVRLAGSVPPFATKRKMKFVLHLIEQPSAVLHPLETLTFEKFYLDFPN